MSDYEASTQFPELFKQLEAVERDIKGGSMAVVALIIRNRLYVANVGKNSNSESHFMAHNLHRQFKVCLTKKEHNSIFIS